MDRAINLKFPKSILEKLEHEARKSGLGVEEYILELILENIDPEERVQEYIEAAKDLLEQSREEIDKGNIRQAAEKIWGATALAIKAYAELVEGKKLTSHRELWEFKNRVEKDFGEWVYDAWMSANGMHTCFYEGWCGKEDAKKALKKVSRLVDEIGRRILQRR